MSDKKKLLEGALEEAKGLFPNPNSECNVLCERLEFLLDELPDLTGKQRRQAIISIWAIERQLRAMKCLPCPFM